jgi:hypothetical protein
MSRPVEQGKQGIIEQDVTKQEQCDQALAFHVGLVHAAFPSHTDVAGFHLPINIGFYGGIAIAITCLPWETRHHAASEQAKIDVESCFLRAAAEALIATWPRW